MECIRMRAGVFLNQNNMKIGLITGKVIEISQPLTGTSQKGQWTKYSIKIQGDVKWDFITASLFNPAELPALNEDCTFEISLKGNEYNGRIYNETNAKLIQQHKQEQQPQSKTTGTDFDMLYKPTEKQLQLKMEQTKNTPEPDDLPF